MPTNQINRDKLGTNQFDVFYTSTEKIGHITSTKIEKSLTKNVKFGQKGQCSKGVEVQFGQKCRS